MKKLLFACMALAGVFALAGADGKDAAGYKPQDEAAEEKAIQEVFSSFCSLGRSDLKSACKKFAEDGEKNYHYRRQVRDNNLWVPKLVGFNKITFEGTADKPKATVEYNFECPNGLVRRLWAYFVLVDGKWKVKRW